MSSPTPSPPPHSASLALANQVGGHAGVLTSEDGSILIKPALPLELQFYQNLSSDSGFASLCPYIPNFMGTLRLEGEMKGNVVEPLPQKGEGEKESIVLENLSHGFSKPNIMDIKLGTVLYDEAASPEKVERMKKTARETTSGECGVRLTGFQVHGPDGPKTYDKVYGKSLKPSDLPSGIRNFFPSPTPSSPLGLPRNLLLPILENIKSDILDIREALSELHMRMVGASLLILYEGDVGKAEEEVGYWLEGDGPSSSEDEEEDDEEEGGEGEGEGKKKRPHLPYTVKLIDFAHTRITPGQGPDEGVLKGVDTVLRLIEGRIREVEEEVKV